MNPPPAVDTTYTPDDIMAGRLPEGRTIVYDDDHFYMASVIAEKLRLLGNEVVYLSPGSLVSSWSANNYEQVRVQRRLIELDIEIILNHGLDAFEGNAATLGCNFSPRQQTISADNLVMVTCRTPCDQLYYDILEAIETNRAGVPKSVKRISDAEAPSIIAAATFAGHKYARELDCDIDTDNPTRHDRVFFE